jgi:hypothetical protein
MREKGPEAPVGYADMTTASAIGLPLTAIEPRITAAIFGGVLVYEALIEAARQRDERVGLAGVADQGTAAVFADPVATGQGGDHGGAMAGLASKSKSSYLGGGTRRRAAAARRAGRV